MVKTKALSIVACALVLAGCGLLGRTEQAHPDLLTIAKGKLGRQVSLVPAGATLVAVYSDWETTGLFTVEIPVSDGLPSTPPAAKMIDKIDMTLPVSPTFGEHVAAGIGTTITVMYVARVGDDKIVLKVASRDIASELWSIDALEPSGSPLAIVAAGRNSFDMFWAAGSLLRRGYPGAGQPDALIDPFAPADRAGVFSAGGPTGLSDQGAGPTAENLPGMTRGMTVYDTVSRSLYAFRWNGSAYERIRISGAGPVQSSLLLGDGSLAILSWDQGSRRLELLDQKQGDAPASKTLVTLCDGTTTVALLGSATESTSQQAAGGQATGPSRPLGPKIDKLLFLYNSERRLGGGKADYELSLLAPGSGLTAGRYRRIVLMSGPEPITSFSAVEAGNALYALVHQGSLKLLRMPIPR